MSTDRLEEKSNYSSGGGEEANKAEDLCQHITFNSLQPCRLCLAGFQLGLQLVEPSAVLPSQPAIQTYIWLTSYSNP